MQEPFVVGFHDVVVVFAFFGIGTFGDDSGETYDGIERGAYLVAHVGKESRLQLVGSLRFLFGHEQFPLHPFHFGDVPFDAQQDRGEVVAFDAYLPFVQKDGLAVLVVFLGNPVFLYSGSGYFDVLRSLFLCDVEGVEVEVVLAQRFFQRNVAVVRFAVAVQVFKAASDVFYHDAGGKILDGLVQNLTEPLDLLLILDALGDVPAETPENGFAFVARHPIGASFHGQYFGMVGQGIVEDETAAFFSLFEGVEQSLPEVSARRIHVYPVDVQFADVVRHADVVMLPEAAVGKDERTVLVGGEDVFGGVVDGVCQQVDVVAPLLDVGDVLYVPFQKDVSVGLFLV